MGWLVGSKSINQSLNQSSISVFFGCRRDERGREKRKNQRFNSTLTPRTRSPQTYYPSPTRIDTDAQRTLETVTMYFFWYGHVDSFAVDACESTSCGGDRERGEFPPPNRQLLVPTYRRRHVLVTFFFLFLRSLESRTMLIQNK